VTITSPDDEEEKVWAIGSEHAVVCMTVTDQDTCKDDPEETIDDSVSHWWVATRGTFPSGNIGTSRDYLAPQTPAAADITVRADDDYAPAGNGFVADDDQVADSVVVYIIAVDIQINDTPDENDDVVQIKNEHPAWRFTVPCRAKVLGSPPGSVSVTLTNADSHFRFPGDGDTQKDLSLPCDGSWVSFLISGETGSAALNNAVIEALLGTDRCGAEDGTVFWFDNAVVSLMPADAYSLMNGWYRTFPGPAMLFAAAATIRPDGLDCAVAQISTVRVGFMQQVSSTRSTITYGTPNVAWAPDVPVGTELTVPSEMVIERTFSHCVPLPVADTASEDDDPLYTRNPESLRPPIGCPGGGFVGSNDMPNIHVPEAYAKEYSEGGQRVATVTWTALRSVAMDSEYTLFCVIYNVATDDFCAQRQIDWSVHVNSATGPHTATGGPPDAPASEDPAETPPSANDAEHVNTEYPSQDTITFSR
jgi:hypothetical protein